MDDLAALDWTAPVTSAPQRNGGRSPFDTLAATRGPIQHVASPAMQRGGSSNSGAANQGLGKSPPAAVSAGDDAFSSLFGSSPSTAQQHQSLSMAERLARQGSNPPASLNQPNGSSGRALPSSENWDFDMLSGSTSAPSTSRLAPLKQPSASVSAPATGRPSAVDEDADDPFGLNSLAPAPQPSSRSPSPRGAIQLTETPPIATGDDFDILGDLARPVSPPTRPTSNPRAMTSVPSSRPNPTPSSRPASRAPSPPPHILGQLVSMGFGIEQSRTALSATYGTDWDVQGAAEALMGAQEHEQRAKQSHGDAAMAREEHERARRHAERRRPTKPRTGIGRTPSPAPSNGETSAGQPDLLAQASEIGLNVFNRANTYWQSGRKAVQKVVEERRSAATTPNPESNANRRPRWMTDVATADDEPSPPPAVRRPSPAAVVSEAPPPTMFKDSDDEDSPAPPTRPAPVERAEVPKPPRSPPRQSAHRLQADPEPKAYVSPHRHAPSSRQQAKPSAPTAVAASPRPAPQRPVVTATTVQLSTSESHRTRGNELFKLGRYADAGASYTAALDALPVRHLSRVPLLTNRAQSALHNGEPKAAIEDCTAALLLLGALHALVVAAELESAGKALGRRARAYEAAEKWSSALDDWTLAQRSGNEVVRGAGGAKVVSEGVARCRRMVTPPSVASNGLAAKSASVIKKPARRPAPTSDGRAVAALKAANQAAESEEAQRLVLKDEVDARLTAWRGGKETNLRALIASLDSVLWADFGWQKVGLHELVTEGQLKVRYVKAIARLHPDKLSPATTTLEQRMIANGVFSTLNEAWNAHKPM